MADTTSSVRTKSSVRRLGARLALAGVAATMLTMAATSSAWATGPTNGVAEPDGALFSANGMQPSLGALNAPIVGWAPAPGDGAWEVASDGGVFGRGASFYGSMGAYRLNQPIVAIAATPDGHGYWLVASDGGVFSFGNAAFYGSVSGLATAPAVSVIPSANGYDVTLEDGSIWHFGPGSAGTRIAQLAIPSTYLVAEKAIAVALAQVGKPYAIGGNGPGAFDCSGLTRFAYAAAGVALPRTAAEQLAALPKVPLDQAQPGDLLFFYPGITHVGIYLGDGLMVDAPHVGAVVRVEPFSSWFGPVMGVARPR